jgi:hypothetical protein
MLTVLEHTAGVVAESDLEETAWDGEQLKHAA